MNLLIALVAANKREKRGLQSNSAIVVASTFPTCGKLTFPQHLEITPHIWWLLALLCCSSSSASWHSRCSQWESASLLAVSHQLSACCPQPITGGAERKKGPVDTNPVAVRPGPVSVQGLAVPRSVLAQRFVLQDATCAIVSRSPLPSRDNIGLSPLVLWSRPAAFAASAHAA